MALDKANERLAARYATMVATDIAAITRQMTRLLRANGAVSSLEFAGFREGETSSAGRNI
jgi:hypothetical protein